MLPSTAALLQAWRDAARAAKLAHRLETEAAESADRAELDADVLEQIAATAAAVAEAADDAAARARDAAAMARAVAVEVRRRQVLDATDAASAEDSESAARDLYRESEREARELRDGDR